MPGGHRNGAAAFVSGLGIREAWRPLTEAAIADLPATLGVYEIGDADGSTLYIGYAGGRSLFGLRSALGDYLAGYAGQGTQFRVELNMQYISRWKELLMDHRSRHGVLPPLNPAEDAFALGRLGPQSEETRS